MKKTMDKLFSKIKINKKIFIFLLSLSIVSLISGSFFAILLKDTDKAIATNYLESVIKNISHDKLDYIFILKSSIFANLFLVLSIWILGISVIGLPIIVFLFFSHIFTIGFLIANIVLNYKFKGILISFIYIFPHSLILIIILLILTSCSLIFSLKLITAIIRKKQMDFKIVFNKYLIILFISIIGILLCSLYETFVLPNIINLIISLFN